MSAISFKNYFTDNERDILSRYFIEQDITEDSFVASDIEVEASGQSIGTTNNSISISGSDITRVDLRSGFSKYMYTITGGTLSLSAQQNIENGSTKPISISGDVIRGTIDHNSGTGAFLISLYVGSVSINGNSKLPSGMITVNGTYRSISSNIQSTNTSTAEYPIYEYKGSLVTVQSNDATVFVTTQISDFKRYSVQMELFDYAVKTLSDVATPNYEFSLDTANFLFAQEFEPFRENLELGMPLHLRVHDNTVVRPILLEYELDFENWNSLQLVFANTFKRTDNVNTLKDMLEKSYSSTRSFDASKYIYNKAVSQVTAVSKFMSEPLDAAVNSVLAASDQSVVINGAGIQVGGVGAHPNDKIRIINNMICMTDDDWQTAKLAIGRFATEDGTYWGVNADLIAGKLIVGENLMLQNGNTTFMVDETGAYLENSTLIVRDDTLGGTIIIDPSCGIVSGTSTITDPLYTVDENDPTKIIPDLYTEDRVGNDVLKDNVSFYLDIEDGTAYFKGHIESSTGHIGGWSMDSGKLYSGSDSSTDKNYVGFSSDVDNPYAIWVGDPTPENAPFYVMRDGSIKANNGTFSGTLDAAKVTGILTPTTYTSSEKPTITNASGSTVSNPNGWIYGCGINVGNGKFIVDQDGNVKMTGNITWDSTNTPVQYQFSINGASWHSTMNASDMYRRDSLDGGKTWGSAYQFRGEDGSDAYVPSYITSTGITRTTIKSPTIYGGTFHATGKGSSGYTTAAYYINNGYNESANELGALVGYLSFDTGGSGEVDQARTRVFLHSEAGYPLKIDSGSNMSLTAAGNIYLDSPVSMRAGVTYGTASQRTSISDPVAGQIFFQIS